MIAVNLCNEREQSKGADPLVWVSCDVARTTDSRQASKITILDYEQQSMSDALLTKRNETAFITVSSKRLKNGQVGCRFDQLLYCKNPTYARFIKMAQNGNVYLDLTLAMQGDKARDHGFLWRVPQSELPGLCQESRLVDLAQ